MNILSLFDGMSCGQIALNRANIKYNNYFASEIDKHAIKVTQHNFPKTIQVGDVTQIKASDLPKIDLLIGGSPCQGFSFAGKQLAFDDPRSKLFFEFVRLKNELQPKYFLLENVKMKKEFELIITDYMGVSPIVINSALVSAQNRVRLYWTNIANESYGLFGDNVCTIPQPEDKGILLKDILEKNVDEKYYLSEKMLKYFGSRAANLNKGKVNIREENDKATCLTASYASCDISDNFVCVDASGRFDTNKTGTLTATYSKGAENYGSRPFIAIPEATKKGYAEVKPGECFDATMPTSETRRGRLMEDKSNCLTASKFDFMQYTEDFKIRRLTPTECKRLQTVPDEYDMSVVSDSQQYRMLGNGWTIDVITHILSYIVNRA
jgi:DNA-cytosine methyltransferase